MNITKTIANITNYLRRFEFLFPARDQAAHSSIGGLMGVGFMFLFYELERPEFQADALGVMCLIALGWEVWQGLTKSGQFSVKDMGFSVKWTAIIAVLLNYIN